jgi:antitoxin component YwqK of YwqJK toxin-antitoxin module
MKTFRNLLTLVLLSFSFTLFAQQSTETTGGDTINKFNANNQKTGYWVERNGELTNQGVYKDGKKTGNWVTLLSNNLLNKVEFFNNGLRDGISVQFDRKAKIVTYENYKNGELNGTCVYYGPYNENPTKETNYANGKLNGITKLFYDNGKIQEESYYKANLKSGPSKWYNKDGKIIASYNYINGLFEGMQTSYYENDSLQSRSDYKNNLLNGDYKEYYRNGKLKESGRYLNGLKEGPWTEYDETGKVTKVTKYKEGQAK